MKRPALCFLVLLAALLALGPLAASWDYAAQDRDHILTGPGPVHWLGTDTLGRDNLARFLYGGRLSVILAALAALGACTLAAVTGAIGALGGPATRAASAVVFDVMLSTPWFLLVFLVRAIMPLDTPPLATGAVTFAILGLAGLAQGARAVRDAVTEMTGRAWMRQAQATGSSGLRLWRGHVVPNLWPILATQFLLLLPVLMLGEATLGMLGLGIPEPLPSWGGSLVELVQSTTLFERPWALVPAGLLAMTAISLRTLAGEETK